MQECVSIKSDSHCAMDYSTEFTTYKVTLIYINFALRFCSIYLAHHKNGILILMVVIKRCDVISSKEIEFILPTLKPCLR